MSRAAPPSSIMALRGRKQPPFWRDLSISPAIPAAPAGAAPPHTDVADWGDAVDQLPPPPPLFFLEDKMVFPEGREGPSQGGVVNYTSPAGVFGYGDVAPQGRGGLSVQHSSSLAKARAGDLISWRSPLLGSTEGWPYGQEQEAQRQPQGGVVMDAVNCHWEAVRPALSSSVLGSREAAAAVSSYSAEGEEWVTVFGFGVDETNLVLREFEKCGPILNYVPGPGTMNWIHLQYQSSYEAESALRKNGMQLNSALIVGVKPLDRLQRLALTEASPASKLPAFLPLPPRSPTTNTFATPPPPSPALQSWGRTRPYSSLQLNESRTAISRAGPPPAPSSLASPVKSTFSKLVDLVFGL